MVKRLAVVAVEAIEGTDRALQRGGELAKGGAVAVKVAKEGHDVRFDIPCIGPQTVDTLEAAGIAVLAIEAGCTILLDPDQVRAAADQAARLHRGRHRAGRGRSAAVRIISRHRQGHPARIHGEPRPAPHD